MSFAPVPAAAAWPPAVRLRRACLWLQRPAGLRRMRAGARLPGDRHPGWL